MSEDGSAYVFMLAQLTPAADYDGVLSVEWHRVDNDTKIDDIPIRTKRRSGSSTTTIPSGDVVACALASRRRLLR